MKAIIIGIVLVAGCIVDQTPPGGGGEGGDPGGTGSGSGSGSGSGQPVEHTALSTTLFINTEGVALAPGSEDAALDQSSVVSAPVTVGSYLQNDPQRQTKITALVQMIQTALSPYAVTITTTRPAQGPYTMVVWTDDSPLVIGVSSGVASISPITCNMIPSVIGLVFTKQINSDVLIARFTVQSLAIAAGIPRVGKANDCMCAGAGCNSSTMCTITSGASPVINDVCDEGVATIDVNQRFITAFGQ